MAEMALYDGGASRAKVGFPLLCLTADLEPNFNGTIPPRRSGIKPHGLVLRVPTPLG
jgi:hypothetical protein